MKTDKWLDIRQNGFVRLGLAVPVVRLSHPQGNADETIRLAGEMNEQGAQIAVYPELGLTGYSNYNLFHQQVIQEAAQDALARVVEGTRQMDMLIVVGLPFQWKQTLFNCCACLYRGSVLGLVPKSYLPNYGEYRELLYFRGAEHAIDSTVRLFGKDTPFGWDLLFQHELDPNLIVHCEICEDGWEAIPPSHVAALHGATVLLNSSASNVTGGKGEYRRLLARATSGMCNAVRAYVSAGRGETSTDASWDGHTIIAERGSIVAEGPRFARESYCLLEDVHLDPVISDNVRQHSRADNRVGLERRYGGKIEFRELLFGGNPVVEIGSPPFIHIRKDISPLPFVPKDKQEREDLCFEIHNIQAHALADRWKSRPDGTKLVLNFSGGKDSLNALGCCVHAARLLKRSAREIVCLTLPGYGTTPGTLGAAEKIAEAFGVDFRKVPIVGEGFNKPLCERPRETWGLADHVLAVIGHDGLEENLAYENSQAWVRTVVALATGAQENGFMVGTGTLSELAVGWCTMFGDHASHYGINAGLAKTLELEVLRWQADHVYGKEHDVRDVMHWVCDEVASPELKRPDASGRILQNTDGFIGPLDLRDFYLYWGARFGITPRKIVRMGLHAYEGQYELEEIVKWQRVFWSRFVAAQVKRNCLPESAKVGLVCLSPRGDWHMPSDAYSTAWLADLDRVAV